MSDHKGYNFISAFVEHDCKINTRTVLHDIEAQINSVRQAANRFGVSEKEILYALKSGEVINVSTYKSIYLHYSFRFFKRDIDNYIITINNKRDLRKFVGWCRAVGILMDAQTDRDISILLYMNSGHHTDTIEESCFSIRENSLHIVSDPNYDDIKNFYAYNDILAEKSYKTFQIPTKTEHLSINGRVILLYGAHGPVYGSEKECAGTVEKFLGNKKVFVRWDDGTSGVYKGEALAKAETDIKFERKWVIRNEKGNKGTSIDSSHNFNDNSSDSVSHESKVKNKKRDEEGHKETDGSGKMTDQRAKEYSVWSELNIDNYNDIEDVDFNSSMFIGNAVIHCRTTKQNLTFFKWCLKNEIKPYSRFSKCKCYCERDSLQRDDNCYRLLELSLGGYTLAHSTLSNYEEWNLQVNTYESCIIGKENTTTTNTNNEGNENMNENKADKAIRRIKKAAIKSKDAILVAQQGATVLAATKAALNKGPLPEKVKEIINTPVWGDYLAGILLHTIVPMVTDSEKAERAVEAANVVASTGLSSQFTWLQDMVKGIIDSAVPGVTTKATTELNE